MTKINIQIWLISSFIVAFILGVYIMIWWYKKISKKLNRSVENRRSIESIGMKSLYYNLPSLIMFILLFIPSLYFGYLLKQHTYCKGVVEINSKSSTGFDYNNPEFIKDCGCYDINEFKIIDNE